MTVEQMEKHITRDPAVLGGKPVIRGMRIPVSLIAGFVEAGDSVEEILDAYPVLTRERHRGRRRLRADGAGANG